MEPYEQIQRNDKPIFATATGICHYQNRLSGGVDEYAVRIESEPTSSMILSHSFSIIYYFMHRNTRCLTALL